jgi:hypothetical protein
MGRAGTPMAVAAASRRLASRLVVGLAPLLIREEGNLRPAWAHAPPGATMCVVIRITPSRPATQTSPGFR